MSFFRFCRQGLTALPVFLLFSACDKLLPTGGSGELVSVKIRSVSVKGYGEASATRSAGGESRIIGQPIIQDLGDGMLAEITVEEDVSALRAGDKSLTTNAWFRIIAIKNSDKTYLSHADFRAKTSGEYTSASLHVPSGVECDFICFSYNSTTASLPEANYTVGALLPTHTMDGSTDFLYQRLTEQEISAENSSLSFDDLKHQLAKVTLILNGGSRSITSVADNSIKISSVATPTSFNLTTNMLSGTTGAKYFTGWGSTAATTRQDLLRLLPKSGTSTLSLPAEAIIADGYKSEATSISLPALGVGKSYTVRVKLFLGKSGKLAGSNIYWDSDNSRLTFVEHGTTTPITQYNQYQGVYFKWGSLIGISPVYAYSNTVLYRPTNTSDPAGTARTWTTAAGSYWGTSWDNIPYFTATSAYGTAEHTLLKNPDFTNYKGDICNYINPAYRMPTADEFLWLTYNNTLGSPELTVSGDGAEAGRYLVPHDRCGTFIPTKAGVDATYRLPASGFRLPRQQRWRCRCGQGGCPRLLLEWLSPQQ